MTPDTSRSSSTSCKFEDEASIPPLQDPDYRRDDSPARLHPVDPNAWPTSPSQLPATLEQLTGHDLMAMFPTQAPKQPVCCDDIFRSQVRDFLARQTLPVVIIQESPEVVFGGASDESSRARAVEDVNLNARSFVPRQRRTSKQNESYVPPLTRRPLHRNV